MAAVSQAPVLDLETLAERPRIRIDGVLYDLVVPDALSLIDFKRVGAIMPRVGQLWSSAKASNQEDQELKDLFDELCRMVVRAPAEVVNGLTALQKVLVYRAFLQLPSETLTRVGALMPQRGTSPAAPKSSSTGATSSRGSRASTAGRRSTGSRGRPLPSSVPA